MPRNPDFSNETRSSRRPHHVAPNLASVKVIFIIHQDQRPGPGSDSGLGITTNSTAEVLRLNGVDCQIWRLSSYQQLWDRLELAQWSSSRPITHVIINTPNFILPGQFGNLAIQWPEIHFVQLNHTGLSYLSIDQNGPERIRQTLDLQQAMDNVRVAGNNPRFQWFDLAYGIKPLLLPNLFNIDKFVSPIVQRKNFDPLRIGCFGEGRPWKNQLVASMAAISLARRLSTSLELWINEDRWPQTWSMSQARAELYANLPGAKLEVIPWLAWPKFRRYIRTMDLLINPSFDETFCCVVADGIAEGIPSVVTSAMEWAPRQWWASAPEDPANIAAVGMTLLHDKIAAIHDGRQALTKFTQEGIRLWIEYLTS